MALSTVAVLGHAGTPMRLKFKTPSPGVTVAAYVAGALLLTWFLPQTEIGGALFTLLLLPVLPIALIYQRRVYLLTALAGIAVVVGLLFGFSNDSRSAMVLVINTVAALVLAELSHRLMARWQAREAALIEKAEQLRIALEAAEMRTWHWDIVHDRLIGPAPAHGEGFSYPASFQELLERVHPDDRPSVGKRLQDAIAGKAETAEEYRFLLPEGGMRWIAARGHVFRDATGRAVSMVGVDMDITQRKEAEEALANERTLLRTVIDNVPDYVFVKDTEGRFLMTNQSNVQLLRARSIEEVVGKTVFDFFAPALAREYHEDDQKVLGTGEPMLNRLEPCQVGDGSQRWLLTSKVPLRDKLGVTIGIVGIGREITEFKQAQEALAQEHSLLRTLIDHLPDYISIKDRQSRFIIANRAQIGLTGVRTIVGKNDFDYFPHELAQQYFADDQKVIATGEPLLNHMERAPGDRWVLTSKVPLRDHEGQITGLVCLGRDITEQLNLEAQLRQAQKMESIGQLAAGIAHDFNNILNIILGYSTLLLDDEKMGDREKNFLQQISHAAERAANLTRQLLAFSRKQVLQSQPLDLAEVVNNMKSMLTRVLGEHITLEVEAGTPLPRVHADVGMMEQIILNLAVNARDAMPRGGQLSIGAEARHFDADYVKWHPESSVGDFVCLKVGDTGTGIPKEILPRIFDPFFTTKDVGKGTGLGLSTVYGIVKQHQGWIEVQTTIEAGTTFFIFLPVEHERTTSEEEEELWTSVSGGDETILVVEDEAALRELARRILENYGYDVLEAANGVEALKVWQDRAGKIDLLLTDMMMPGGISGRELAERLHTQSPQMKVIYTTGYSVEVLENDFAVREGADFLQKPYHPAALARLIRTRLDEQG